MADTRYLDIELGFDRVEAMLIAERCKAEGLDVAIRLMDDNGNAPTHLQLHPHRLTTTTTDADAVRQIIDAGRTSGDVAPMRRRHPMIWLVGVLVGLLVAASFVSGLIDTFG